jgi:catechol 2,3-dioxygenase-like lactoylglutathione lyase family enzyme
MSMPVLAVEHIAWNVAEPAAIAAWYVEHLGMRIVRQSAAAPFIHFIADSQDRVVLELYCNDADPIPDYASQHPLRLHLAFATSDPDCSMSTLLAAGATFVSDQTTADGSRLIMLRDPWGLALQLCKRVTPLIDRN